MKLPLHILLFGAIVFLASVISLKAGVYLQSVPFSEVPPGLGTTPPAGGNIGRYPDPDGVVPSSSFNGTTIPRTPTPPSSSPPTFNLTCKVA